MAHAAVLSNRGAPECLAHVGLRLRDDLPFMLDACTAHGRSLAWASPRLQANRELVLVAAAQDPEAMRYASEHITFEDDDEADANHHRHTRSTRVHLHGSGKHGHQGHAS